MVAKLSPKIDRVMSAEEKAKRRRPRSVPQLDAQEPEVREWWNAKSLGDRASLGMVVCDELYGPDEWQFDWDDLMPLGQQMRLHMYYNEHVDV